MPHDLANNLLQVGDEVTIRCRVTQLSKTEEACNLTCTPVESPRGSSYSPSICLNTGQVLKWFGDPAPAAPGVSDGE